MREAAEAILSVGNLCKSYGELKAVRDLSFHICEGEIFGLLGPNGAGKSTTLECVLGTREPDSGNIDLLGFHLKKRNRDLFNRIGVQFQNSRYPDRIRVDELCRMISVLYSECLDWREMLPRFGLDEKRKSQVSELSGGERQKLSLLLALINKPKIVFLDELTTGLDPQARRNVWSYLTELKKDGLTILLTSHYMEEVQYLCDRILIINKGNEVITGTPESVIASSGQKNLDEAYLHYVNEEVKYEETIKAL